MTVVVYKTFGSAIDHLVEVARGAEELANTTSSMEVKQSAQRMARKKLSLATDVDNLITMGNEVDARTLLADHGITVESPSPSAT